MFAIDDGDGIVYLFVSRASDADSYLYNSRERARAKATWDSNLRGYAHLMGQARVVSAVSGARPEF